MSELKAKAAQAALDYIEEDMILGVGTGSTVNYFIQELASVKHKIEACVASSRATEHLLRAAGLPVIELNAAPEVDLYVDGADEVTASGWMIKGGGGALTREKIVAEVATRFICIVEERKLVTQLGEFPLAIEVIPMARSLVARHLVRLGGDPEYREGFVTDNGNIILDVFHLPMDSLLDLDQQLNAIVGLVEHGLFVRRGADVVLMATPEEVRRLTIATKMDEANG